MIVQVIKILHLLLILWIVFVPFLNINNKSYLKMIETHSYVIPFLLFHWYTNDTCLLTEIEKKLTGKSENETFIGRIIKPIYNVTNKEIHIITILLWFISIYKLKKYNHKFKLF